MNWRIHLLGALVTAGLLHSVPAYSTDYIYRDLMANTLVGGRCDTEAVASENARKDYNLDRFAKKFCQSQGYGWHVKEVKDQGKTECTECTDKPGLKRCFQRDVVVTCQRIKPGSVGMLPGQG